MLSAVYFVIFNFYHLFLVYRNSTIPNDVYNLSTLVWKRALCKLPCILTSIKPHSDLTN